jgi:hypothetical protein
MRLLVLLTSAFVGAAAAGIYLALTIHQIPPLPPPVPGNPAPHPPLEFTVWFLELWIIFLLATYYCGRMLYAWLGAPGEAEVLHKSSEEYLAFIQAFAGCYMLASGVWALIQAKSLRLSLVVGTLMIIAGVRDWWRYRQSRGQSDPSY